MTFATITIDQPFPVEGEFEVVAGANRFALVIHPRIDNYWMAFAPPRDWRDAGMKKFATRKAAVRHVSKAIEASRHLLQHLGGEA